jgi:hypothetical protein
VSGEAQSTDIVAAEGYSNLFGEMTEEGGYLPEQMY